MSLIRIRINPCDRICVNPCYRLFRYRSRWLSGKFFKQSLDRRLLLEHRLLQLVQFAVLAFEFAFEQAHAFYERYGGITIVLARFMPFIRTFAPFVAGVAEMHRGKFTAFNVGGALLWVLGICTAGYFLGGLPWVKANLDKIIWAMIFIPGLIAIYGAWKAKRQAERDAAGAATS